MLKKILLFLCGAFYSLNTAPPAQSSPTETINVPNGVTWRALPSASKYVTISFYGKSAESMRIGLNRGDMHYEVQLGKLNSTSAAVVRDTGSSHLTYLYPTSGVSTSTQNISVSVQGNTFRYYQVIAMRGTIHLRYYDTSTKKYVLLLSAFDRTFNDATHEYTHYSFGKMNLTSWTASNISAETKLPGFDWDPMPGESGSYQYFSGYAGTYCYRPGVAYNYTGSYTTNAGPLSFVREWDDYCDDTQAWHYDTIGSPLTGVLGDWSTGGRSDYPGYIGTSATFYYSRTAQRFSSSNITDSSSTSIQEQYAWFFDPSNSTWTHARRNDKWRYIGRNQWIATLPDGTNTTTKDYTWTYDEDTQEWIRSLNDQRWHDNGRYTWTKVGADTSPSGGFKETWGINTNGLQKSLAEETQPYFYQGLARINSQLDANNRYQPHTYAPTWRHQPASGELSQTWSWDNTTGDHGTWSNGTDTYTFNETTQTWQTTGDSERYFPPHLPPLYVVRHQAIISAYRSLIDQGVSLPEPLVDTLSWENNGRSSEFNIDTAYSTSEETAPLKTTTSSPDTQLLHDLTHNPVYTAAGNWHYKDTTNGHTWEFDKSTGAWRNTTTDYEWQHSDLHPGQWSDSLDGTTWAYDENTGTWNQTVTEEST